MGAGLVAAAALACPAAARQPPTLDYTLSPELKDGALIALDVSLRLTADSSGVTRLDLPDREAGTSDLWRYLDDVQVDGAQSVSTPAPAVRIVRSRPAAPLTVRYRVVSAFPQDPDGVNFDPYKPAVRPQWFWAYGEALFVRPDDDRRKARFRWAGPKGFPFASDLEHPAGRPMSLDQLRESVAVGGPELSIYRRDAQGPLRIAVIGAFPFSGGAFADTATRIVRAERAFWRAKEGPFLVALAPLATTPNHQSTQGEGRGDAFSIMTTANVRESTLKVTLAHEYFHTWNPDRLGGMHPGDAERADYWFSEGFTDFFGRRLLLRSGEFDAKAFAGDWNEALLAYAGSPARSAPGAQIVEGFWKDRSVEKLPYQRGAILAAVWDQRLRERSHGRVGLDYVVRAMRERAQRLGPRAPKAPQLFVETALRFGLDPRPEIAAVIDRGGPALLPANAFPGFEVRTLTVPAFDIGFDYDATRAAPDQAVRGVRPDSAAYAAGLRDGMTYLRRQAGKFGDSRETYTIRVRDQGAERSISFKPEGKATLTLQELSPRPASGAKTDG
ncbi:M61 family peptidase [Phenylobacterium sp.]|jgi:predicted metalloprotease with PDZ domain|uniref:M61 family metallopeptidase n=1 Tax=Phenylobacterium sp. TaxID=1871053 RepID=UPI002F411171